MYNRKRFLKEHPDLKIKIEAMWYNSGYTEHKALCTWSGDWDVQDLVNFVDNSTSNYGGRTENEKTNPDGSKTGTVVVYID